MGNAKGILTISLVTAAFVLGFAAGRVVEKAGHTELGGFDAELSKKIGLYPPE
mgnify:CR=1 FL=1